MWINFSGYMLLEYGWGGIILEKFDIYSFGVLLLEIILGKKVNKFVYNDYNSFINYVSVFYIFYLILIIYIVFLFFLLLKRDILMYIV